MSTAAAKAARSSIKKVVPSPTTQSQPANLFTFLFAPKPAPINITTNASTKLYASEPTHPLHLPTQRRLSAFDPNKLHWKVTCSADFSKKVAARNWAVRRVRDAFREELKGLGWGVDGASIVQTAESGTAPLKENLRGALVVMLNKDKSVMFANGTEVREQCAWLVRRVLEMQGMRAQQERVGIRIHAGTIWRIKDLFVWRKGAATWRPGLQRESSGRRGMG